MRRTTSGERDRTRHKSTIRLLHLHSLTVTSPDSISFDLCAALVVHILVLVTVVPWLDWIEVEERTSSSEQTNEQTRRPTKESYFRVPTRIIIHRTHVSKGNVRLGTERFDCYCIQRALTLPVERKMFQWSGRRPSSVSSTGSGSSGYPGSRVAPTIAGSIRPPPCLTRQQHLDSYLDDPTLQRSTRRVSNGTRVCVCVCCDAVYCVCCDADYCVGCAPTAISPTNATAAGVFSSSRHCANECHTHTKV